METNQKSKKLVYQADFVVLLASHEISFNGPPDGLIPVNAGVLFSIEKFSAFFIKQEQQLFVDFFVPANWADKSIVLTMSTNPEAHIKGKSCSVFIQQNGVDDNGNLAGTMINISQFLPGEYLFKDLAVFVDGLSQFRKITHDLNNQFQIITGFGSAIEDEMTDPDLKECATNVMDAVGKAIEHNKDLRKFFPPKDKPELFLPSFSNACVFENQSQISQIAPKPEAILSPGNSLTPDLAAISGTGILVIDDEPLVQRFLCEMLKRLKYAPTGCANGSEALAVMQEKSDFFSLAIVDMNLPDIASENLYDQLRQIRPDLKVILISGDNLGETSQRILNKGAHGFLQKPTTIKTLAETIGQILAGTNIPA